VAMFLFFQTIVGSISPLIFGYLQEEKSLDPNTNADLLGKYLSAFTIIPCALSIPFFLIGGCKYRNIKVAQML